MIETFKMTGKTYETDEGTLAVLRGILPGFKKTGDASAVAAIMELGLKTGRIVETKTDSRP